MTFMNPAFSKPSTRVLSPDQSKLRRYRVKATNSTSSTSISFTNDSELCQILELINCSLCSSLLVIQQSQRFSKSYLNSATCEFHQLQKRDHNLMHWSFFPFLEFLKPKTKKLSAPYTDLIEWVLDKKYEEISCSTVNVCL